jgi:hypothetical protein
MQLDPGGVLWSWMNEIATQSRFSLYAYSQIQRCVSERMGTEVFFYIYALLNHAGNIVQLLNSPEGPAASARQQTLQQELAPSLGAIRAFRNDLAHYDERLLKWLEGAHLGAQIDMYLGSPETFGGVNATNFFRAYDPATATVYFQAERLDLAQVATELARIGAVASAWVNIHLPDGRPRPT